MMLLRAKKYDPAIQSLNYSISLKPNYGTAYTYRGFAREGLREKDIAVADYKKAMDYDKTFEWTTKKNPAAQSDELIKRPTLLSESASNFRPSLCRSVPRTNRVSPSST